MPMSVVGVRDVRVRVRQRSMVMLVGVRLSQFCVWIVRVLVMLVMNMGMLVRELPMVVLMVVPFAQ